MWGMSALLPCLSGATLHVALEARQPVAPELGVAVGPLRHLAEWAGGELVDPLPSVLAPAPLAHESGVAQHTQVARHGGSRHVERRGGLHDGRPAAPAPIQGR